MKYIYTPKLQPHSMWQGHMDAIVWNVGHGSAASVRLPNGAVVMLDCGPLADASSSPALATLRHWGHIDVLSISHPDMDHIGDICNAAAARPPFLVAPQVPASQVLEGKNEADRRTALFYLGFERGYRPFFGRMPFGYTRVEWFSLGGYRSDMNEYSIVTFIQHGWLTLLYAGDLPARCWPELLMSHGIRLGRPLQQTNFLVIPHHGRRDAYSPELMGLMESLQLGIISDDGEQSTSATSEYGRHFAGWPVCSMRTGKCGRRRILTTRNDGHIAMRATFSADGTYNAASIKFGGRHG